MTKGMIVMKKMYALFGLLCLSTVVGTAGFVTAQMKTNTAAPDDSVCQITLSNGNVQDLSNMCGQASSTSSSDLPPIDLNAPSPVVLVGSPTPPKHWDSLPNLKEPPQAGKTEPMKPSLKPPANPSDFTPPQ